MKNLSITIAFVFLACAFPNLTNGSTCESAKITSVAEAQDYLRHMSSSDSPAAVPCVELAFKTIGSLPPSEAAKLLVGHLDFKRPLSASERLGIFMHEDRGLLYPAVQALFDLGSAAETALVQFIGSDYDENSIAHVNAVHTLELIEHGDAPKVVQLLVNESKTTTDNSVAANLRSTAKSFSGKSCLGNLRKKCDAILTQ